jgi:protease-4
MEDQPDVTMDTSAEPELSAMEHGIGKVARWVLLAVLIIAGLLVGQAASRAAAPVPKIGIIRLYDVIDYGTAPYYFGPLRMASERNDVAAVVIFVDSPGGYATVSEELFMTIRSLRDSKPVVASIEGIGASGSYYAAAGANYIVARPAAYVGSIGVRSFFPEEGELDEETYTTGPFKDSGFSSADFMRDIELMKEVFLSNVYDQRVYALEHMHEPSRLDELPPREMIGTGQIWVGTHAYQIGLVDELGSNQDAIEKAAELAGIANYEVVDLFMAFIEEDDEYLGYISRLNPEWYTEGPWVELYYMYYPSED